MSISAKRLWLCIPPFLMCMLDQGITLWGQSSGYWAGQRHLANEANPVFHWLLRIHPLAFEAGIFAWVLVFSSAIVFLPRRAAMAVSIAVVTGHAVGATTWLLFYVPGGYWLSVGLALLTGTLVVVTWERFDLPARRID